MQKKLIALAVAGMAAAPAFAQSSVTVYGIVDLTMERVQANNSNGPGNVTLEQDSFSATRQQANSSYIGFKGTEDLGNGLKALFQIETGFNPDSATSSSIGSRDSYIGLTGGFGTVLMGTLTHPVRAFGAKHDYNPGATGIGFTGAIFGELNGFHSGTDDRAKNIVAYVSPSFSGFSVTGAFIAGENRNQTSEFNATDNGGSAKEKNQYQLAAQYANGPAFVGVGYHVIKDYTDVPGGTSAKDYKDVRIMGQFDFGQGTSISALWDRQGVSDGAAALSKRSAWSLGVRHAMGPHAIHAAYAKANEQADVDDTSAKMWTVGYEYSLSKRTMVKAYYANLKNDDNARYDFYTAPVGTYGSNTSAQPDVDVSGFGVGLRHAF